jgi:hypothetical protein
MGYCVSPKLLKASIDCKLAKFTQCVSPKNIQNLGDSRTAEATITSIAGS